MNSRRAALVLILLLAGLGAFLSTRKGSGSSVPGEEIARLQAEERPFVIYFYSETCVKCREMETILTEVRPEFSGVMSFVKVDANDPTNRAIMVSNRVRAVPSLVFSAPGEKPHLVVGIMPADRLRENLRGILIPAH
jgi:thioredoxin-like negative regulator of GroEL